MSDLLKIKRLVDGDDTFRWRVEAACWARGVDVTEQIVRAVASNPTVVSLAEVTHGDTILSEAITDEAIFNALDAHLGNTGKVTGKPQ